jgi:integral membrane protein (TIGR00529 family)
VYPGLILAEAMTGMSLGRIALLQLPMTFFMAAIGVVLYIRLIEPEPIAHPHPIKASRQIVSAIWPIVLAIIIYGAAGINLNWAVLIALVALIVSARPGRTHLFGAIKEGISWKLILMVFGILSFQSALELTGAIESIPRLAAGYDLPAELVVFLVCFSAGLLTGMVSAFIALGYTILAGFLYDPVIMPGNILLAYVSGMIGIMLSPAHLCLILTNEYFHSDLGKVYRLLIPAAVLLAACGLGLYYSGWPGLF